MTKNMDLLNIARGLLAVSVVIWHSVGSMVMLPLRSGRAIRPVLGLVVQEITDKLANGTAKNS